VRYETRAGTATSGVDYLPTQGRLDWADGDASDTPASSGIRWVMAAALLLIVLLTMMPGSVYSAI
jgi:hypothetical protein